jgi:addiction module HigA family antidote
MGLSQNKLAAELAINPGRLNDIVHGKSAVTANIALRLARYFGTSPEMWLALQSDYDLRKARREHGETIEARVKAMV